MTSQPPHHIYATSVELHLSLYRYTLICIDDVIGQEKSRSMGCWRHLAGREQLDGVMTSFGGNSAAEWGGGGLSTAGAMARLFSAAVR